MLWIVAVAWLFVVGLVALVELTSPRGSVAGALGTLMLYGLLPLALVMWLMGASLRRRRRHAAAAAAAASVADPDRGGHAAGDAIAPEREEG
jgi:choline-glycine betaine transporter